MTWSVATQAQGQGYATEAAAAALDWQQSNFAARRTVCLIHRDNGASLRVAEKLGYAPFRTCDYKGYPAIMFERRGPAVAAGRGWGAEGLGYTGRHAGPGLDPGDPASTLSFQR